MLKKFMAKRCDNCPLCNYARKKPDTLFAKLMKFHGKICPFWKAWDKTYGKESGEES